MMAVGYLQDMTDFVADTVFPSIPVTNKSDSYFKWNRSDFFRNNMQKRAPGAPAQEAGYKLATATYTADVWAELFKIADQIRANSDAPLQPDRDAVQFLTQQAKINRDVNWVSAYFGGSIWGNTDQTGVDSAPSTNQFLRWNLSGSDPVSNILATKPTIKSNTGFEPNMVVLGYRVMIALLTNAAIIDRLKYGQTAPGAVDVSMSDLQALFKMKKVVVAGAIQTTSANDLTNDTDLDATATFDFIAGKHALSLYAAPGAGIMVPSAGYTFNWTGLTGGTAAGIRIKRYRWEVNAADHVEIDSAYAFGLVGKFLGQFLATAID